jgi:hypothetical protein
MWFWIQIAFLVVASLFTLGCLLILLNEVWPRNHAKDADHRARMKKMVPP